jgi:hypothetical protein
MGIKEKLESARKLRHRHFELGQKALDADSGKLLPVDIYITAALNRSVCILKAFIDLIEQKNIVAAAPLIRLQVDNACRLFAGTLVSDPHDFVVRILEGVQIRKQKDRSGRRMTDRYLIDQFSKLYPWANSVYTETSGYVHLSEKHFFHSMRAEGKEATFTLKISDEDAFISEDVYVEAISAFHAATEAVFELVEGWIFTKENPEIAAKELTARLGK